jgi:hypothetical protein
MTAKNLSSNDSSTPVVKKPYEKPAFRYEQVFVTSALSCGKQSATQSGCGASKSS